MAAQGAENVTATSTFRNLTIVDDYYLNVDWAAGNFVIGHDQCVTVLSEDGLSKVTIRLLPSVPPPHHRRLEAVTAVAASKDGQYIAVATSLPTLCLLSVSTHTLLGVRHIPGPIGQGVVATHGGRVMFLGSDGKRVASGSSDGTIRVWSLFGAQKQHRMMTPDSLPLDLGAGLRKTPKKDLKSFFNVRTRGGLMLDPHTASMSVM
ncbi:WD domain, G-beta repeat [Carpediemonas membranifera]|uniref:WD domain, G-beta repeat n=1 Tax=Carpediemonas membranifera TaxID=201153 RepID=A0A8J6B370_9EUKA|nr:WD domain, G-beta repeat [Carpediemonas membranifera]|eukprot:KAG9391979.1 WD domain, G-beta repeat [Carpediemonas membranifera]